MLSSPAEHLPLDLETDEQKEQRHEAVVDPLTHREIGDESEPAADRERMMEYGDTYAGCHGELAHTSAHAVEARRTIPLAASLPANR